MYALSANPTAREIILRSIVCHPTTFIDYLSARADEDIRYAHTRDGRTRQAALASSAAYGRAMAFAAREDLPEGERAACIIAETGPAVVALNAACKLQCIPSHVRTAAAVMLDES